jgi:hypothetical protein
VANSQRRWQLAADVSSQSAYIVRTVSQHIFMQRADSSLLKWKEGSIWWCFEAFFF